MNLIPTLLTATIVGTMTMVLAALFARQVTSLIRRYFPTFSFEEGTFLLWGLLLSAAFVLGFAAIYLLLRM